MSYKARKRIDRVFTKNFDQIFPIKIEDGILTAKIKIRVGLAEYVETEATWIVENGFAKIPREDGEFYTHPSSVRNIPIKYFDKVIWRMLNLQKPEKLDAPEKKYKRVY